MAWVPWFNTIEKKFKFYDGTAIRAVGSEGGRKRGMFDASGGNIPTAADATVDPNEELKDGDYFIIGTSGEIANLPGEDKLEIGDFLYVAKDAPAAATDFYAVQGNVEPKTGIVQSQIFTGIDLVANTPKEVIPTDFSKLLKKAAIYDPTTNEILSDAVHQEFATEGTTANGKIVIESLTAETDLTVVLFGN